TNRDLREMIAADQFREDLFFRINTFEIHLAPLRERKADIPSLAQPMLSRFSSRRAGSMATLPPAAADMLTAHDWPGNVRALANAIERATILSGGGPILPEHLPTQYPSRRPLTGSSSSAAGFGSGVAVTGPHFAIPEGALTLRDVEMKYIQM